VDLGAFGRVTLPHQSNDELLGKKVTLGVRPEHLSLRETVFKLSLKPAIVERLGIHSVAYSPMPSGENFIALFEGNPRLIENEPMAAYADPAKCHLFDEQGLAIPRPGSSRAA
jgi:multiple sugar transport system ATP-binding protein